MFIQFDSSLLEAFEDIIKDDDPDAGVKAHGNGSDDDEETTNIPILDANSLTLTDLLHEMERRGLHPRGFFADDAKVLQDELNKEHEEYLESKLREKREARDLEVSQRLFQRRNCLTEIALREEKEEIEKNEVINEWCCLIKHGKAPRRCRIDVNNVSARSLARLLWSDSRIVSLDVSNLNLSDTAGAYLARMLKKNRSLVKLEMGDNILGCDTCVTIAESLRENNVLEYLSIESNPLTLKDGASSIQALATIVRENESLRYLSLWRCNIGVEGGRIISEAMKCNERLICVEMGYNHWQHSDIIMIKRILGKNKEIQRNEEAIQRRIEEEEREVQDLIKKQEEKEKNEDKDQEWLEEQKNERSKMRRIEMHRLEGKNRIEEEERQKELEVQRLEEEKKKKKPKRKKKGKKVSSGTKVQSTVCRRPHEMKLILFS